MSHNFQRLALCLFVSVLYGCSSAGDYLSSINPFASREERLQGERRPILTPDPSSQAPTPSQVRPVTVSSPVTMQNWPNPGGPSNNAPPNIAIGSGGAIVWKASNEGAMRAIAPPLISNGFVFLYDGRHVSAFNLNSGKRVWSVNAPAKAPKAVVPGGGIATDGHAIYVASSLRLLAAFDANSGQQLWSVELTDPARSAPTIADGRIYVVSAVGVVSAHSTSNGAELWRYASPAQSGGLLTASSPAVYGKLAVVPFSSGELVALDAASGAPLWSSSLLSAQPVSGVTSLTDVAARPVISGGIIYAGGVAGRFMALKSTDGSKVWEQTIATGFAPVVAGNGVFVLGLTGDLYAFDNNTGEVRWSLKLPKGEGRTTWAGLVLANSSLWLVSNQGMLLGVDAGTGLIVSQQNIKEGSILSPIAADGKLIIATLNGSIIAL
jgi:outer membrane protein assembly factor BamB